jgi:putative MFS transporter
MQSEVSDYITGQTTQSVDDSALKRLHILIIAACALGFSFDLAEIAFGSILSAVFSAPPYGEDKATTAWLLSAVYMGAIIGAPVFGGFADSSGRRVALIFSKAIRAVTSVGAAWAPGIGALIAFRGASGLALGAFPPLMFSFLADVLPASRRGRWVMVATALGYAGPTVFIFLVRWLTPIAPLGMEAWRWGFLFGGAGAGVCAIMFAMVPESPRWLSAKGRHAEAKATTEAFARSPTVSHGSNQSVSSTTESPPSSESERSYRGTIIFLLAIYFLTPWATVGFTLLSGAVLVQKGVNLQDSLLYLGISTLGPIVGTIVGGYFVDRVERRNALISNAVAMAAIGLAFGWANTPVWLITCGVVFNLLVSLFLPVLILYAAEMVPNTLRARTTSYAWTANRIGSALTPLVLLPVLHSSGPVAMFAVIAVTLILFIALVVVWGPLGKAGRRLN